MTTWFVVSGHMLPPKLLGVYFDIIHFFAFVAFSISSFVFMHVTFIDFLTEQVSLGLGHWVFTINFIHSALSFNLHCAIVFFIVLCHL